jgi:hypothetical protein
MAEGRRSSWKLGCVIVLLLPLAVVAIAVSFMMLPSGKQQLVERTLVQTLPPPPGLTAPGLDGGAGPSSYEALRKRVVLDLSGAELFINSAPAGSPIRVQANFDAATRELTEVVDTDADMGWTYIVTLSTTGTTFSDRISSLFRGAASRVTVLLPLDAPMAVDLRLTQSSGLVDFGGLWLTEVDVDFKQGGLEVVFSEPVVTPLQRFNINGVMGGISVGLLGNASPRNVVVEQRMGGFDLDLRGAWQESSEIALSVNMGGGGIRLPEKGVATDGLEAFGVNPANEGAGVPVLRFSTEARMGGFDLVK